MQTKDIRGKEWDHMEARKYVFGSASAVQQSSFCTILKNKEAIQNANVTKGCKLYKLVSIQIKERS